MFSKSSPCYCISFKETHKFYIIKLNGVTYILHHKILWGHSGQIEKRSYALPPRCSGQLPFSPQRAFNASKKKIKGYEN